MQGGRKQVGAGYILYGSSTILVYTTGHGVNCFTYEHSLGEFFLSKAELQSPTDGTIYSCNDGNFDDFPQGVRQYLQTARANRLMARYIGSLVGDFHRNLLKGGIYLYPPTPKAPNGKLRLLYECYPLALIAEQAGGLATDGQRAVLDIAPMALHQRTPFYIGASQMVNTLVSVISGQR